MECARKYGREDTRESVRAREAPRPTAISTSHRTDMTRLLPLLIAFVTIAGCASAPTHVNRFESGKCYGPDYNAPDCVYKF